MPAMVVRLTAPGPRPFLAMESDARQSGTCAPQARTVTPSRSADIPIVSQPDANTHRLTNLHLHDFTASKTASTAKRVSSTLTMKQTLADPPLTTFSLAT